MSRTSKRRPNPSPQSHRPAAFVCLLFFASGAAALVYEVSWARQAGLIVGHTADGAAVVLTAYFAGLAVGCALGARLAGRVSPPVGYAAAEFAAAGWACLAPALLAEGGPLDAASGWVGRWAACCIVLLPATAALGATLPFVSAWLAPDAEGRGRLTTAYACNTAGAFAGTVAATTWLLPTAGVAGSGYVAAALSAACGFGALAVYQRSRREVLPPIATPPAADAVAPWAYAAVAVSGFGIIALEVLYARLFSLVFHNSTYTFGAVLAAVLLALALGSLLARRAARRMAARTVATWAAGAGGLATLVSLGVFAAATRFEYVRLDDTFGEYLTGAFGLAAAVVVPPLTLLGTILPATWLAGGSDAAPAGGAVGRTAFANTVAAALGAVAAGLAMPPAFGLWGSFAAVAALFAAFALALLAADGYPRRAAAVAAAFAAVAAVALVPPGPERWAAPSDETVLRRWNTAYGWIDVVETMRGTRNVRQNMHYRYGTTGRDAPRAYRQARLPILLHPQPDDVLFLGLGTGMTAAGAVSQPGVERVVVVELIPEVVEAARLLADDNLGVVDHPKVAVVVDDARHYLRVADRTFDVIVSDLFVPWESEVGYLYTVEHYRAAKQRLKPGGVFCQWLAAYQVGPDEFEMIADSVATVFPDTSVWWGNLSDSRPIIAFVGSDLPPVVDAARIDGRLPRAGKFGPPDPELLSSKDFVARYVGHWPVRHSRQLNTDEYPRVEFLAPRSHGNGTLLRNDSLRTFFDGVLATLPDRASRFAAPDDGPIARRAWQRLTLFPE